MTGTFLLKATPDYPKGSAMSKIVAVTLRNDTPKGQ